MTEHPLPTDLALLAARLDRLRRWLVGSVVVEGLGHVLGWGIAFAVLDALLDRAFVMDRPQRMVMLLLAVAGAAYVTYRSLWRPLRRPPSDAALCWEVERLHPQLRQQLLAAWQLGHAGSATASPQLVQAAISQGLDAAAQTDFLAVLDRRRLWRNSAIVAVATIIVSLTVATGFTNDLVGIWFSRNVLLTEREWPQDVHFRILGADDGVVRIPVGEEWPLEIALTDDSRRFPDSARLEFRGDRSPVAMEANPKDQRYRGTLPALTDPTEFRVAAFRAVSPWLRIELVERPEVDVLELIATPPSYTGLMAGPLPAGGGPYTLLPGTALAVRGTATQPLSKATLSVGDNHRDMRLSDGKQFQLDVAPADLRDGEYRVELTSTQSIWLPGETGPQPLSSRTPFTFRLRLAPDREPQVTAKLKGITTLVTPRALIPLEGDVIDDFAVTKMELQYRHRGTEDAEEQTGRTPLTAGVAFPTNRARWEHGWELEPLQLPVGTGLSFLVEAADNNTVTGPGLGRSTVFLVRVVSDEELRTALLARERTQRAEFEKRIKQLDELRTECLAVRAAVKTMVEVDAERREQLARATRRQKTLGDDLSGIARRFEDIALELQLNRLEEASGPLHTRLTERIITPLWAAASEQVPPIVQTLERARQSQESPAARDAQLATAAESQQRLLEGLKAILAQMESAEGFQEAVNRLVEVQQAQEDVLKKTEAAKQEAIRRVLDGKK
ncbi:MAG: hypothetical protein SH850_22395 [Planctomycetaceae bacterium]|nr:hypothetical protein [Planctomycetaceae bacterium]